MVDDDKECHKVYRKKESGTLFIIHDGILRILFLGRSPELQPF